MPGCVSCVGFGPTCVVSLSLCLRLTDRRFLPIRFHRNKTTEERAEAALREEVTELQAKLEAAYKSGKQELALAKDKVSQSVGWRIG